MKSSPTTRKEKDTKLCSQTFVEVEFNESPLPSLNTKNILRECSHKTQIQSTNTLYYARCLISITGYEMSC